MDSAAGGRISIVAFSMSFVLVDQTLHDDGSCVKVGLPGVDRSSPPNTELAPVILLPRGVRPTPWGRSGHSTPIITIESVIILITDPHVPHAAEAILGYEPTEPYSQRRIDCKFCCVTATRLNSDLLLPGASP